MTTVVGEGGGGNSGEGENFSTFLDGEILVPVFRPLDFLFRLSDEQRRALTSGNDQRCAVSGLCDHLENLSGGVVVGVVVVVVTADIHVDAAVAAEARLNLWDKLTS